MKKAKKIIIISCSAGLLLIEMILIAAFLIPDQQSEHDPSPSDIVDNLPSSEEQNHTSENVSNDVGDHNLTESSSTADSYIPVKPWPIDLNEFGIPMMEGFDIDDAPVFYPTVMVNGKQYKQRPEQFLQEQLPELPENCEYYGEIIHVMTESPEHDCEFVFDYYTTGQIYTVSEDDTIVYLIVTLPKGNYLRYDETVAVFDLAE